MSDLLSDILSDPLVLDLDGDGIELTALASSTTYFDLDDDGVAERTGWVSPHDGLLVQDANANGQVDGVGELFGSFNVDGYDELATIDSNGDGRIDALDPAFADLKVWRDLNSDGVSTSNELQALPAAGIAHINLAYSQVDTDAFGNLIARTGTYGRTDDTTRIMASVQFALDESGNRLTLPDDADLGSLPLLPNLPASAATADLRTAMFFDPVLKGMVEDLVFSEHDFDTFQAFAGDGFIDVLYQWAGVDTSIPEDPDSPYHLEVFEALTGMPLELTNNHQRERLAELWPELVKQLGVPFLFQAANNPMLQPLLDLSQDFASLNPDSATFNDEVAALLDGAISVAATITPAYDYLDLFTGLTLNPSTGELSGDFDAFVADFVEDEPSFFTSFTSMGGGGGGGPSMSFGGGGTRHPWTAWYEDQGSLLFHVADAMGIGPDYVLNVTGWRWLAGVMTTHDGTDGNDLLEFTVTYYQGAGEFSDSPDPPPVGTHDQLLFGYEGDDELRGNDGVDRLVGGAGADLLKGGSGSDMYVYASGDGLDRIVDASGAEDTIYFSSELDSADLRVARLTGTNDLLLHFGDAAQGLILVGQWGSTAAAVEQFHFVAEDGLDAGDIASLYLASLVTAGADTISGSWAGERIAGLDGGDTLSGAGGNDFLEGGGGGDALHGGDGNDRIEGGEGNDWHYGNDGNDTLIGGAGNDSLRGDAGVDTYVYNLGDGDDVIYDGSYDHSPDETLIFGAGITPATLIFSRVAADWDDIRIGFIGQAGSILLDEQNQNSGVETMIFSDGTIWNEATMLARYVSDQQTEGDDTIHGTELGDVVEAGGGNDIVVAGEGNDTLIGGAGNDSLQGGAGVDTYVYNLGDGDDVIYDGSYDHSPDETLIFGAGITPSTLIFSRVAADWDDIRIGFIGQPGSIVLDEQNKNSGVETVIFADGTMWNEATMLARYVSDQRTEGDDTIHGTELGEVIDAGAGNDLVAAGEGNDTLIGGAGNDSLQGGSEVDTYIYNPGDGDDVIYDVSNDSSPDETLIFGAGIVLADLLFSRVVADGSDLRITFKNRLGSIILDHQTWTSAGIERFVFADGSTLTEAAANALIIPATDGSDILSGTAADDEMWGLEGADLLSGGDGNDALNGGGDADQLDGNAGDDALDGGAGSDVMTGGAGNDSYWVDQAADQIVENGGEGDDRVTTSLSYALGAAISVETLEAAAGTAAINLTGNEFANMLVGNAGSNVLKGLGGADAMAGNGGNDFFYVDSASDQVIELAGGGSDRVYASASYGLAADAHVEILSVIDQAAATAINLNGNGLAQTIIGNAGVNHLNGHGGDDLMNGLGGDDFFYVDSALDVVAEAVDGGSDRIFASTSFALGPFSHVELLTTTNAAGTSAINLTGNSFVSTIAGNAGVNVLDGKGGYDTLIGYGGADTFAFTTALGGGNADRITDFAPGTDKIALDDIIFTGIGAALDASEFVIGTAAADASDRIIYNSATGALFFDPDGAGGAAQIHFATPNAGLALTASDFAMI